MRFLSLLVFGVLAACMPVQNAGVQSQAPTNGWVLDPPGPPDNLGRAYVTNGNGVTLTVACGNGGEAGMDLTPDPRLPSQRNITNAILMFNGPGDPTLVHEGDDTSAIYVVMPMRV